MAIETAIVSTLLKELTSLLREQVNQEASLIIRFKEELQDFGRSLKYIRALLNDAQGRKKQNEALRTWLLDLQDVVYDAEYIFEECEVQTLASAGRISRLKLRHKMGKRVRELKKRIAKITELGNSFHLRESPVDVGDTRRHPEMNLMDRSLIVRDESKIVGTEENTKVVTDLLLQEAHARIIAVVGMGGVGKTLLLHRVFDRTRHMFECSVWLTISQDYSIKNLQQKIGRRLNIDQVEKLDEEETRESISSHLKGKKSLIVLDDVWNGKQLMEKIGIPQDKSCRVLISTRNREVAEEMGDGRIHKMLALSEDDSWRLFCNYAFPESNGVPPEALKGVGRVIAEKCANLPLAIIMVAASMAKMKPLPNVWNDALDRLNELHMENEIRPILELSYDAMHSPLQLCFLYCSAFPEDSKIDCQYLIELWIAEGFVTTTSDRPSSSSSSATDIGRCYLNELISRCMLEPLQVGVDGRVNWCKMHDLLRELALDKAHTDFRCFFRPGKELKQCRMEVSDAYRRISLWANDIQVLPPIDKKRNTLRALFLTDYESFAFSRPRELNAPFLTSTFFENLKALRILDLSSTSISNLPESFSKLEHLRVLNLSGTYIEELPESINNMRRLEYLDLSGCVKLKIIPAAIGTLKLLRHLNLTVCPIKVMPAEISQLTSLETLILGSGPPKLRFILGWGPRYAPKLRLYHLQNLTNLRELDATMEDASESGIEAENAFGRMKKMRRLSLRNFSSSSSCFIQDMKNMEELETLYLHQCFPPSGLASLQNLVDLDLHECHCTDYPRLDSLPNLCHLTLRKNRLCKRLPKEFGRPKGFPKLEKLSIIKFDIVEELPVLEDGAMPKLKELEVRVCPLLFGLPSGIDNLPCLVNLEVFHCARLVERLEKGGSDISALKERRPHLNIILSNRIPR